MQNRRQQYAVSPEVDRDPEFVCGELSFGWDTNHRCGDRYGHDQLD